MKLPYVEKAEVPEAKVVRYLLSTTYRAGKSKASFFTEFGERQEAVIEDIGYHLVARDS